MHSSKLTATVCLLALVLCCVDANLPTNTNPAVVEFGTADPALLQCFDKTIYEFNKSPSAVSFISPTNINYVKVETLKPGLNGGVAAEITSGAIKKPNIVITLTEPGRRTLFRSNIRITMFCAK
ncbi:AGAP005697-PA-like protein [Anopheles sinensis]|uniref:AGAP005697-PA-like protein n=1 Tax=Anopheles sinensis TaxID=74873 RepID=A0A084W4C4_ANOSI|nr:AGAP005697-PA-like protein [Anopheles sinensis]